MRCPSARSTFQDGRQNDFFGRMIGERDIGAGTNIPIERSFEKFNISHLANNYSAKKLFCLPKGVGIHETQFTPLIR